MHTLRAQLHQTPVLDNLHMQLPGTSLVTWCFTSAVVLIVLSIPAMVGDIVLSIGPHSAFNTSHGG